jgi:hypothetical protein
MKTKQITTTHTEIGYVCNIEIIEKALREEFLLDDQSYCIRAVAAHIWSTICSRSDGNNGKNWGTEEVILALVRCRQRLDEMHSSLSCTRKGCGVSYPHITHE